MSHWVDFLQLNFCNENLVMNCVQFKQAIIVDQQFLSSTKHPYIDPFQVKCNLKKSD